MNEVGYRNLTELISRGWTDGQRQGRAILDKQWVMEQSAGLIALSGGREGEIGRHLLSEHEREAKILLEDWQRAFPDRFYLELIRTGRPLEEACVHASVKLAIDTQTPVVATNDVRFWSAMILGPRNPRGDRRRQSA